MPRLVGKVPLRRKKVKKHGDDRKMVSIVRHELVRQSEEKYGTFTFTGIALNILNDVSATGRYMYRSLSNIAQGVTDTTRAGDGLTIKNLYLRINVLSNASATGADQFTFIRTIVFQWMPTTDIDNSTVGLVANVPPIYLLLAGTSTVPCPDSQYNHDRKRDYRIMYDKTETMSYSAGNSIPMRSNTIVIPGSKFARRKIQYNSGSTTNQGGGVCLLMLSYNNYNALNPLVYCQTKLTFTDS